MADLQKRLRAGRGPVVLVTGASQGLGRTMADRLGAAGFRVFGTSRIPRPDRRGVAMRELEVTDDDSVRACVQAIEREAGAIDVLVSNAARTVVAPAEETPLEVAASMMDVNFFGTARVVQAVLPGMRRRRRGQLVLVSSLAGKMGLPGQAFYCSSKHALEAYADALHAELAPFGVRTSVLEPGSYRTQIIHNAPSATWDPIADYDGQRERYVEVIHEATDRGADPERLARLVERVIRSRRPKLRYRVEPDGRMAMFWKSVLPESVFYRIVAKRFGQSRAPREARPLASFDRP